MRSAGTILLNRTELFPEAVTKAVELVEQLNPSAQVLAEPWKLLTAAEILSLPKKRSRRMRSPMRSTPVPVGIITTTTAMPAAVTPMPGAARMTPLIP